MTFVVRLVIDAAGRLTGVIERVRTGQKERFLGVEELGSRVADMVRTEAAQAVIQEERS